MGTRALGSRWALASAFLALLVFLSATYTFRRITDNEVNSFQTRALVKHGDVHIERYPRVARPAYFAKRRNGHLYSIYGVGISVVAAPAYVVLTRFTDSDGLLQAAGAIPFVAAGIVLMFVLLSRLAQRSIAVAGTIVFGFGTTMWPLASMGLYQHGPVAFFHVLGLLGMFSERERAPALAGLGFAAAAFVRLPTAIPLVVVGVYYLTRGWRRAAWYAAGAVVPIVGLLIQNRWLWGSWLEGGYSNSGIGFGFRYISRALPGLSFGAWRGIFVYSPILLVSIVGLVMVLRRLRNSVEAKLFVLGVSALASFFFYTTWSTWWNGLNQFGYRYLLDVVPFLVVLGGYAAARSERIRLIAIPLGVVSILTMTAGAGPNKFGFDGVRFPDEFSDTSLGQAWIALLDRPLSGLLRLAGVTAIACMFALIARARAEKAPPLFDEEISPVAAR